MKNSFPIARYENIVVQELAEEVLVCDLQTNKVFCLNQTAGEVWKMCDGKTDVAQIAKNLSRKLRSNVTEELVIFAMQELSRDNLLEEKSIPRANFNGLSRREVIRRVGLASVVALPIISSITMPLAIHAASSCVDTGSGLPLGCTCPTAFDCESSCCVKNVCLSSDSVGCDCFFSGNCLSGCCIQGTCRESTVCSSLNCTTLPYANGCTCSNDNQCATNVCCVGSSNECSNGC